MSSKKVETTVLQALICIRDRGWLMDSSGICVNVRRFINRHGGFTGEDWAKLKKVEALLFMSWEKFSGNTDYPIPHPDFVTPQDGYINCWARHMWDHEHPYGALRWEMVHHMIKKLEEKYP